MQTGMACWWDLQMRSVGSPHYGDAASYAPAKISILPGCAEHGVRFKQGPAKALGSRVCLSASVASADLHRCGAWSGKSILM